MKTSVFLFPRDPLGSLYLLATPLSVFASHMGPSNREQLRFPTAAVNDKTYLSFFFPFDGPSGPSFTSQEAPSYVASQWCFGDGLINSSKTHTRMVMIRRRSYRTF